MSTVAPRSLFQRFLGHVERAGNALPHPATLFVGLAALVVLLSWILHAAGTQVVNPSTGKVVASSTSSPSRASNA